MFEGAAYNLYVVPGSRLVVVILKFPFTSVAFVPKGRAIGSPTSTPCAGHATDLR